MGETKTLTFLYLHVIQKRLTIMIIENTKKLSKMQKEMLKIIKKNRPITQRDLSIILSRRLGKRDSRNLLDEADEIANKRGITDEEERWRMRHHYLNGRKKRKHNFQTNSFRASFSRSFKRLLSRGLIYKFKYPHQAKKTVDYCLTEEGKKVVANIEH